MADENSDNRQQEDSVVGDGGVKCGNADDTNTASSSNSAMADGLSRLISSVMTAFNSRAEATGRSQDQLAFALDRLTGGGVIVCDVEKVIGYFNKERGERYLFPDIESGHLEWDGDASSSIFCLAECTPSMFRYALIILNASELDKLLEDAPSPFIMQHAARISGVRKRVKSLNSVLKSIQRRIDNMDRMLSAGLAHETMAGESSEQQHAQ